MKKTENIVIWGAGVVGRAVYEELQQYPEIQVAAFGDNSVHKQGTACCGKPVLSLAQVAARGDISAVFLGIKANNQELAPQLEKALGIPVYSDFQALIHRFLCARISIDITGWCNARCTWCTTGRKNRDGITRGGYMPLGQFQQICRHLRDIGLIYPSSEILLYDWGEPFLNPDFLKIVAFLAKEGQTFSLSTNASVVKLAEGKELYKTCKTVIFSMSGFSQASYDRIHGFSFAKIKENIRTLIKNMREQGFVGEGVLSYHVYQFNQGEVRQAEAFARSLGLTFAPIYAYFASYGLTRQYLKGILPQALRSEAEKALYLSHVADLIGERPDGFRCQVADMLSLTAEGQVKLCCCSDDTAEHYLWGSVFALGSMDDWKQLRKEMLNCESCRECRTLGVDYWFFNNPPYVCEEQ